MRLKCHKLNTGFSASKLPQGALHIFFIRKRCFSITLQSKTLERPGEHDFFFSHRGHIWAMVALNRLICQGSFFQNGQDVELMEGPWFKYVKMTLYGPPWAPMAHPAPSAPSCSLSSLMETNSIKTYANSFRPSFEDKTSLHQTVFTKHNLDYE